MSKENELSKIIHKLEDHEKRIARLEGKKGAKATLKIHTWYKSGSTKEKIILLIEEGFFNTPHTINEIIFELKKKDYHLQPSDLTFPLREIVHKGLLKRTKEKVDGIQSKKWLYVKV